MFKSTKLLKVVSIIMIVFGVIGVISVIASKAMIGSLEGTMDTSVLKAQLTPMAIAISVIVGALQTVLGILGVSGKGYKIALVGIIAIIAYQAYSIVQSAISTGFQPFGLIGFILPILYLWGLYQSKE
ncbi:hypothetical protein ACTQ6A_06675 [Lachnospiraceae bacterium LCP25S3_G4]